MDWQSGHHPSFPGKRPEDGEENQKITGPRLREALAPNVSREQGATKMRAFVYGAEFEPGDHRAIVVSFPDVPEAITQGDDEVDARAMAEDLALEVKNLPPLSPLKSLAGATALEPATSGVTGRQFV
jgi:hypothetical protein